MTNPVPPPADTPPPSRLDEILAHLLARGVHVDDRTRCAVCGWSLASLTSRGCVRGNCSQRPLPKRFYAPERVKVEYGEHAPTETLAPIYNWTDDDMRLALAAAQGTARQLAEMTQERDKAIDAWDKASDEREELRAACAALREQQIKLFYNFPDDAPEFTDEQLAELNKDFAAFQSRRDARAQAESQLSALCEQAQALVLKWRLEARGDAQQSNQAEQRARDRCASELDAALRAGLQGTGPTP